MFEKSNTQVVIQGKILTMAGYEKEEYLQSIASYLNKKDLELKEQTKGNSGSAPKGNRAQAAQGGGKQQRHRYDRQRKGIDHPKPEAAQPIDRAHIGEDQSAEEHSAPSFDLIFNFVYFTHFLLP